MSQGAIEAAKRALLQAVIDAMRDVQGYLTPDERLELLAVAMDGICVDCGRPMPKYGCHCQNDE